MPVVYGVALTSRIIPELANIDNYSIVNSETKKCYSKVGGISVKVDFGSRVFFLIFGIIQDRDMVLRAVCIFLFMTISADGIPFPSMNFRPASLSKTDRNFHRPGATFYSPFVRHPAKRFPQTPPGHQGSSIRRPDLNVSDILNRMLEEFNDFIPPRSMPTPRSIFFDQYQSNIIHQQTAQKLKELGEQLEDTIRHYERHDGGKVQHMQELSNNRFNLNEMRKSLQKILSRKISFMRNLHSMERRRWRNKYVGIPYHTTNDDHMIVKKPGVDIHSFPQPNIENPIFTPVSTIQSITTQYPGIPEVTTSVDLHHEWEVPEIIAGYAFPITSIATYRPEVNETTEITNSIGQEKLSKPQLPLDTSNRYTDTSVATTISMGPTTEGTSILEPNIIEIPFNEANEPTSGVQETIFTGQEVFSTIKSESFGSETMDPDAIDEIGSTSSSSFSSTSRNGTNKLPIYPTPMLIDLLAGIRFKPVTSSVVNEESTTTKVDATMPNTVTIVEEKFASSMIDNEITEAEIISTFPFTLSTETILKTRENSSQLPALETTMIADEISTIMDTASTGPEIGPESTSEAASTLASTILTDKPLTTNLISETIASGDDGLTFEKNMITEIVSSLPTSTMSPEMTSLPLSGLDMIPSSHASSESENYNFSSLLDEVETTTGLDLSLPSTILAQKTTMVTEILTTVDPYDNNNNSTDEVEETTEIVSTFPSTLSNESSTTEDKKTTTMESFPDYNSAASDGKTTSEFLSWSLSTTIPSETTSWLLQDSEMSPLLDVASGFEYDRFPSSIDQVETTHGYDLTLANTILPGKTTMVTEILTTVDPSIYNSTIEMEITMGMVPTFASGISPETSTIMEEESTTTDPFSNYNSGETATQIASSLSSTILPPTSPGLSRNSKMTLLPDVQSRFEYDRSPNSTDEIKTTRENDSTSLMTIPAEKTTMVTETLTTVDTSIYNSTIGMEITMGMVSTFASGISPETSTIMEGESTSTDPSSNYNSGETTTEIASSLSSTISPTTTSWLLQASETTPLLDTSYGSGYDHFPNSVHEVELTNEVDPVLVSTILFEITTNFDESSTTTDSPFDSSTIDRELTEDVPLTSSPPFRTSVAPPNSEIVPLPDALQGFGYNYSTGSTIAPETITGVGLTSITTIPNEFIKMTTDRLTGVDLLFDPPTIDREITTENVSALPATISTETPSTLDEVSTTIDQALNSFTYDGDVTSEIDFMLPSTISSETTPHPPADYAITSSAEVLSRFRYDRLSSSMYMGEEIRRFDSTSYSTIEIETTTLANEWSTTDNQISINSTVETVKNAEVISAYSPIISTEATTTLDRESLFDSSTVADGVTEDVLFTPVSEITTLTNVSTEFKYNYHSTGSTMTPGGTSRVDSTSFSTIPAERATTAATVADRFAASASKNSKLNMTSMVTISPTIISTETTTGFEGTSRATDPASNSFTLDSETATEIAWSLPATISAETTTMPPHYDDSTAEQNFEYLDRNQANSNERNGRLSHADLDAWASGSAHDYEEQPDKNTLLHLIPLIIEGLRQDEVTPEEEHTLSQVFGDLWSLLREESKRRHGEPMNPKLAIFLSEAGQGIPNTVVPLADVVTDDLESKSIRQGGSMRNRAQFLANFPGIGEPVESEVDDEEYKAPDDAPDYNDKYYYHRNENTERDSPVIIMNKVLTS